MIDELGPVVGIHAEQRKREDLRDLLQCCDHPFAGSVGHTAVFGPSGGDAGDRQCVAVVADPVATFVADQIDFDEPGHHIVPLRPGSDRDLRFEQGAEFGVRATTKLVLATFGGQPTVNGGGGHSREQ